MYHKRYRHSHEKNKENNFGYGSSARGYSTETKQSCHKAVFSHF